MSFLYGSLGLGTGKAVTDLIKAREAQAELRTSEASLRKELAGERKRFEDFRRDETLRTMQIVAGKELELIQHVANLRAIVGSYLCDMVSHSSYQAYCNNIFLSPMF